MPLNEKLNNRIREAFAQYNDVEKNACLAVYASC
jgi:hypothetical protein